MYCTGSLSFMKTFYNHNSLSFCAVRCFYICIYINIYEHFRETLDTQQFHIQSNDVATDPVIAVIKAQCMPPTSWNPKIGKY